MQAYWILLHKSMQNAYCTHGAEPRQLEPVLGGNWDDITVFAIMCLLLFFILRSDNWIVLPGSGLCHL